MDCEDFEFPSIANPQNGEAVSPRVDFGPVVASPPP